jgi:ABC-type sugar transport system permease subunit
MLKKFNLVFYLLAIMGVIAIAWALRWKAINTLSVDYDEDDYLRAAQQYAAVFRGGDLTGLMNTNYRPEHPPLEKMAYGLSILSAPVTPVLPDRPTTATPDPYLPAQQKMDARTLSAIFGTITVGILAIVNPLAGLLLAVHAFTIKYVSEIMLESLPALTSLFMVFSYLRWRKKGMKKVDFWLVLSAIFLGLTAASKYLYCVAGIAILIDWYFAAKKEEDLPAFFKLVALWVGIGLAVFFLADPYLWPDPIGRLKESLFYHLTYSVNASEVKNANYPLWQPFIWLNTSPYQWQPEVFVLAIDPLITFLAFFGLASLWKKQRVYVIWLVVAIVFLLVWPTKWPQYIITLTAPLCLASAEGLTVLLVKPIKKWVERRKSGTTRIHAPVKNELKKALPWLLPGLIAFLVFTILPLLFQFAVSMTDFNSISIRDGLNGGILRAFWLGITGQVSPALTEFPFRTLKVSYLGPQVYPQIVDYITGGGILVFNLLWTILSVSLQTLLGLGVALLLWQKGIWLKRSWQTLFILPWAIPEMIGALMWLNIFNPDTGWLSLAVHQYGPNIPFAALLAWPENSAIGFLVLLISGVWYGFPFMMLAASAGLKMLPTEVYDAAALDGANGWNTLKYVTWPLLMPLVVPAIIIRGIFAFNQFYLFLTFRTRTGTLATLSYTFFNPSGYGINGQFSVSAVLNILTVIILAIFVVIFNRWSKAGEGVNYA